MNLYLKNISNKRLFADEICFGNSDKVNKRETYNVTTDDSDSHICD